jgi:hypothetical protein
MVEVEDRGRQKLDVVVADVQLFEMYEISYRRWEEAQLIVPEAEERQVAYLKESGWEAGQQILAQIEIDVGLRS